MKTLTIIFLLFSPYNVQTFKTPLLFNSQLNKKSPRKVVVTPTAVLESIAIASGFVFLALTQKSDISELKSIIMQNNNEIKYLNKTMETFNHELKTVRDNMIILNNTMVDNFKYLRIDNGFTVELSIRNSIATRKGLEYSEKCQLDNIFSLVSIFPSDEKFSTEVTTGASFLLNSRQRKLSEFCVENLNSLDETINTYGSTPMGKDVVRNLKKLDRVTPEEKISKLIYEKSPLPIMILSALVTDPLKEFNRRKATVHSLFEIDVKGLCSVDYKDYVNIEIGECKANAGADAVAKGCYQLYIRLAVLATVAHSLSENAQGTLLGILYFREGIRDASSVGAIVDTAVDKLKYEILLPKGFEIKISYEFL